MRLSIIIIFSSLLLAIAGCKKEKHDHHDMGAGKASHGSIFDLPSQWQNEAGEKVTLASLKERPAVLAMVYLTCKMVCPRIVADMKLLQKELSKKERQAVDFVVITFDPKRDKPAVFQKYKKDHHLDDNFKFLKASPGDTRELAAVLGMKYKKMPDGEFSHANMLHVMNPKGHIVYQQEGIAAAREKTLAALKALL